MKRRGITLFPPRPDDFATLLELVLLEKPVLVVGARRAPSFFLDVLKTLLFPLSWMLPSIDRLPIRVASDLLSGVVPVRAGKGCEIPNFKGSYLGRFPLVLADFWTRDHLSERSRP